MWAAPPRGAFPQQARPEQWAAGLLATGALKSLPCKTDEGFSDQRLRHVLIHCAEGIIEKEQRRPAVEGSRQGDASLLATRNGHA